MPAAPHSPSSKLVRRSRLLPALAVLLAWCLAAPLLPAQAQEVAEVRLLVESGRLQEAEEPLWRLAREHPQDAGVIHLMGLLRLAQAREEEAEALLKRATGLDPRHPEAQRHLAELYTRQGRYQLAHSAYVEARNLLPPDPRLDFGLASVLLEQQRVSEALPLLEALPPAFDRPEVLPKLVAAYLSLDQPAKAAALLPEVLEQAASSEALVPRVASALVAHGYVPDAARLLSSAPQQASLEYLRVLLQVQESQKQPRQAAATLARMQELFPDAFEPWFEGGRLAFQAGEWKQAAELLERALQAEPGRPDALRQLAVVLLRLGDSRRAVGAASHLLTVSPEDADGHYLLGAAQAQRQEWHAARPALERALALRDDANTRVALGMVLLNLGDVDGASEQVEAALKLDPEELEAFYYRALVARHRGQMEVAIAELERVIGRNPRHAAAQATVGALYLQAGNVEAARTALEQAVALNPELPENHYHLALTYTRLGQAADARRHMQQYRQLREALTTK